MRYHTAFILSIPIFIVIKIIIDYYENKDPVIFPPTAMGSARKPSNEKAIENYYKTKKKVERKNTIQCILAILLFLLIIFLPGLILKYYVTHV